MNLALSGWIGLTLAEKMLLGGLGVAPQPSASGRRDRAPPELAPRDEPASALELAQHGLGPGPEEPQGVLEAPPIDGDVELLAPHRRPVRAL